MYLSQKEYSRKVWVREWEKTKAGAKWKNPELSAYTFRAEIEKMKKLDWYLEDEDEGEEEEDQKIRSLSLSFFSTKSVISFFIYSLRPLFRDAVLFFSRSLAFFATPSKVFCCSYCCCCSLAGNIEFLAAFKSFNHADGTDSSIIFYKLWCTERHEHLTKLTRFY